MSALVDSLKKRAAERECFDVKASEFSRGIGGSIKVRVLTVGEVSEATAAASRYRDATLSSLSDRARELIDNPVFFRDAEMTEVLWRSCRDAEDTSKPAFPSSQWMRDHLTLAEMSALTTIIESVIRSQSPGGDITREQADALLGVIAACSSESEAERMVAGLERFAAYNLLIWAAKKSSVQADEIEYLRQQIERLNKPAEDPKSESTV